MVGKPDSLGFTRKPPPSTFNCGWDTAYMCGCKRSDNKPYCFGNCRGQRRSSSPLQAAVGWDEDA